MATLMARGVPWDAAWAMEAGEVDRFVAAHDQAREKVLDVEHGRLAAALARVLGRG